MHHKRKQVPNYWWDFDLLGDVIVQHDQKGGERVAHYPVENGDATEQIRQAEELIRDLNQGRNTLKRLP